jgi:hypothetical protein
MGFIAYEAGAVDFLSIVFESVFVGRMVNTEVVSLCDSRLGCLGFSCASLIIHACIVRASLRGGVLRGSAFPLKAV